MVTEGLRPPLRPRDVVIIGASLAGLFAAAAAAAAGARTMIIERDVLPDGPSRARVCRRGGSRTSSCIVAC